MSMCRVFSCVVGRGCLLWPVQNKKSSLNIWKFLVHILLKSTLENFEHYFASVWDVTDIFIVKLWVLFTCSSYNSTPLVIIHTLFKIGYILKSWLNYPPLKINYLIYKLIESIREQSRQPKVEELKITDTCGNTLRQALHYWFIFGTFVNSPLNV